MKSGSYNLQPLLAGSWPAASRIALPVANYQLLSTGILLSMGALAALSALLEFKLKMPGNSIIRSLLPIAVGLAMVPRTGAGSTMTVGSLVTLTIMRSAGFEKGLGGTTSLLLLGPALDLALWNARPTWLIYLRLALAGMAANGLAFAVQVTAKQMGWSTGGGGRDFRTWLSLATVTYPLFGLAAGLISGLVLFHWGPLGKSPLEKSERQSAEESQ